MKTLQFLQKLLTGFAVILIAISVLTRLGFIDPVSRFESLMRGDVEEKLRIEAELGDADSQNKLGTFLYMLANKQQGDFTEAVDWIKKASHQQHPIAQMNLGFAYKAGNGVPLNHEKAITLFYQAGLNFLRTGYPLDARDNIFNINNIDASHPLKQELLQAIVSYEKSQSTFRSFDSEFNDPL